MKLEKKTQKLCANTLYLINQKRKYIEPDKLYYREEGRVPNTKILNKVFELIIDVIDTYFRYPIKSYNILDIYSRLSLGLYEYFSRILNFSCFRISIGPVRIKPMNQNTTKQIAFDMYIGFGSVSIY